MKIHPSDELLEELFLSVGDERRKTLRHLASCARCREWLLELPRPLISEEAAAGEEPHPDYEQAFAASLSTVGAWEAAFARERREAPGLFVELLEEPAEGRGRLLERDPRFQTWGLVELLVERSREMCTRVPARAEDLARLALRTLDHLDPQRYRAALIEDLRARAWAHLGNARRVASDLQGAEEALMTARAHLDRGTRDPIERAIFLDLLASLRRGQRQFQEAEKLVQQALSIFRRTGDRHRAGRSLVNLSTILNFSGRTEESIPVLREALELIDPEEDPRLLLCAWHNLIIVHADAGRYEEAWSVYLEARPLYRAFPDAWAQNRRKWARAKIYRGVGQIEAAELLFRTVRDGFMAEGIPYDTALVSLELATLYAEQGLMSELKQLCHEMVPIFASRHIHREALAALAYLRQAAEADRATLEIVTGVADYLRRAEHDPALRFEPLG
jgi:tetratricopeptide (TPR) repeat protein